MEGEAVRAIRRVSEQLRGLSDAFPGFHYLELTGPAVADARLTRAAMEAFSAGAEYYDYPLADLTVVAVHGRDVNAAVDVLSRMADELWLTLRRVQRHFQLSDAALPEEMPTVREVGVPFILIHQLVHSAIDLPNALAAEVASLGGGVLPMRPGAMVMYRGPVEVEGGCLILPGNTVVAPGGCKAIDYARVVAAAGRGELTALHSLHPAFALLDSFFHSCLVLSGAWVENEASARPGSDAEAATADSAAQLIPPSEQAAMLGWAEPASVPTLKRVAALRRAVLARGMTLDERRKPGMGNKTYVPRAQWEDVVRLFQLAVPTAPDVDKAIAALAAGVRLMNTTSLPVSYRCDHCGRVTRNSAPEPECDGCRRHDRLRPLTTPRGK